MHWDEPLPQVCRAALSPVASEKREKKVAELLSLLCTPFLPCDSFELFQMTKQPLTEGGNCGHATCSNICLSGFSPPHGAGTRVLIGISPQLWAALVGQTQPCCI